ncbi:MAG TPA: poly-gamma-glutamate hydrolase family protein, partial [Chitinophagales bacterium]|nr:poly-gamma-glutamate hydrolase family protein [Chitinophagales bacterium]
DELIKAASKALVIHGKSDNANEIVYVGGRDANLRTKVKSELEAEGFTAIIDTTSSVSGQAKANFTNRTTTEKGCQLEITTKLRQKLMTNLFNGSVNRTNSRTVHFTKFVRALRKAVQ